ncbi:MAG TPA: hypothetical protein VG754_00265 [Verrucomicrobiae bacterium]|nr:hypothetical protein [Verrucomicrobiae bacterium]
MKTNLHNASMFFCCGIMAVLVSGCLGPKVLNETVGHVPATDPKVELRLKTNSPADVLVIYDDKGAQSERSVRRAFYLYANQKRIGNGRRPQFVNLAQEDHLATIPIYAEVALKTAAPTNELYAVAETPRRFRLESHGRVVSDFTLPQYDQWITAKKLFLFPAAVGADAVGAAAIAGVAVVYGMCQSGTTVKVH